MDYGRFLTTAWHITRRHKYLWLFGLLLAYEAISNSLIRLTIGPNILAPITAQLEQWQTRPELLISQFDQLLENIGERLFSNALIYLLTLLLIWFVVTLALAVIISTTLQATDEHSMTLSTALKDARSLLFRFIALDTLIYFPLFLILLFIMLISAGAIISTALATTNVNTSTADLLRPIFIGGLCLLPLTCLLVPLSLLTAVFRTLALRETAQQSALAVRHTIRQTWTILKNNLADIFILGLLLWGLQIIINFILRAPISFIYSRPINTPPWQIALILLECLILFIQAIAHTFTAVGWTVAYQEISKQYSANSNQSSTDH